MDVCFHGPWEVCHFRDIVRSHSTCSCMLAFIPQLTVLPRNTTLATQLCSQTAHGCSIPAVPRTRESTAVASTASIASLSLSLALSLPLSRSLSLCSRSVVMQHRALINSIGGPDSFSGVMSGDVSFRKRPNEDVEVGIAEEIAEQR